MNANMTNVITLTKLNNALQLAEQGFWVFPILPWPEGEESPGKQPAIKFKDKATRDPKQIKQWWSRRDYNVGIYTGRFGDNEALLVVDDDTAKKGVASLKQQLNGFALPETREHTTPSGGRHYLYRVPEAVKQGANVLGDGIDTRSDGGYIVAPGSEIDGKHYAVANDLPIAAAPSELVEKCGAANKRSPGADKPIPTLTKAQLAETIKQAIDLLKTTPIITTPTSNGSGYKTAAKLRDLAIPEDTAFDLMWEHWAPRSEGYIWESDELRKAVANGYKYAKGEPGSDNVYVSFPPIESNGASEEPPKPGIRFTLFNDIRPDFSKPMLVKGWLDNSALSIMYGPPNSGKSFNVLYLEFCIATGRDWFGRKVQRGGVVHIALEGGPGVPRRIAAIREHFQTSGQRVPIAVVTSHIDLSARACSIKPVIEMIREAERAMGEKVVLVVIDTVNMAMNGADENSAAEAAGFVTNCSHIRNEIGCHVMGIHHCGKDPKKGMRGSNAFKGNVDTVILVDNDSVSIPNGDAGKQRDGAKGAAIGFKLVEVQIGVDADGDAVTSCVVESAPLMKPSQKFAPGSPEDDVLRLMAGAEDDAVLSPPHLKQPYGFKVLPRAVIQEQFIAERVSFADQKEIEDPAAMRRVRQGACAAFRRAVAKLAKAEKINFSERFMWHR